MQPGGKEGPHAKTAYRSVHTGSLLVWDGAAWPLCCPLWPPWGVQPCALPTALLSTHTGGLGRPARTDESGFISAALAHYAQLGLAFDCVYSGYLAGAAQVALVEQGLPPGLRRR